MIAFKTVEKHVVGASYGAWSAAGHDAWGSEGGVTLWI